MSGQGQAWVTGPTGERILHDLPLPTGVARQVEQGIVSVTPVADETSKPASKVRAARKTRKTT